MKIGGKKLSDKSLPCFRINSKKAQGNEWLLFLIVGIVAAAIVIWFINDSFGFVSDKIDQSDIDTAFFSQKCSALIAAGGNSYCIDKIEVRSKTYITCAYAVDNFGVEVEGTAPTCAIDSAVKVCNKLKLEGGTSFDSNEYSVNAQTCAKWLGECGLISTESECTNAGCTWTGGDSTTSGACSS